MVTRFVEHVGLHRRVVAIPYRRPVSCPCAAPNAGWWLSAGGAGDERGDDVGGVTVQRLAATVIAHRRPWISVTGSFLHVAQRHTSVEGGGDEGMTQRVRSDSLADPSTASNTSHDPPSSMPIQPFTVRSEEDRTFNPFANCQVDSPGNAWSEWHRHQLAALAQHRQGAMPTLKTERFDVGTNRFGDAQPVQRQQRDQGRGPGRMTDRR